MVCKNDAQRLRPGVLQRRHSPQMADFSVPASLVIINLGGNDTAKGPVGTGYQTSFKALVQTVRAKYPTRGSSVSPGR